MVILHVHSILKHLHSSWDAGSSVILTRHFCLFWCQGKGFSAVQDPFITFLPLQECESLLSCLVTLFSAVAKHLCHSLEGDVLMQVLFPFLFILMAFMLLPR